MKKIIFATFALSCPVGSTLAAPLTFDASPLFMGSLVAPNAFILLDDSGSMDWEIMTGRYWDPCAYDSNFSGLFNHEASCGTLIDNHGMMRTFANKEYRNFSYIYANNDNLYGSNNTCNLSEYNALENCDVSTLSDWRMLSSSLNLLYYNPAITYTPWPEFQPALFTAARSNPKEGSIGYALTKDLSKNGLASYHVWLDNKGFTQADTRPLRGAKLNVTTTPNNIVDLWDSHLKFMFTDSNTIEITKINYNPTEKDIGMGAEKIATLNDASACYNILGSDTSNPTATGGSGCKTILQAQQNFANWYQYHRKRSYVTKNALATLISKQPNFRFGLTTLNQSDKIFIEMPTDSELNYEGHNKKLLAQLFSLPWVASGTPLRQGLDQVGKYYSGELPKKNSPITSVCQKNIALVLTDGYWNDATVNTQISDADKDGIPLTLADVARYYYLKDLSPLSNYVATNNFDTASWQHLSTFGINFGNTGKLVDTDGDGWPNPPLKENDNWGNPNFSAAAKIDDLWHATYNSKGAYASVFDGKSLLEQLNRFVSTVQNHNSGAAAPELNTMALSDDSVAYFTRFNTPAWTGELLGYPVVASGLGNQPTWQAAIKNPNDRVILTKGWNKTDKGAPFRWPNNFIDLKTKNELSDSVTALLAKAPSEPEAMNTYGLNLINYLRGDKSLEQSNQGPFRNRTSLLGDIIHSHPIYVGTPVRFYPDTVASKPYSEFKKQYASRMPMVYVGANDGMLHGFSAQTGEEKIAYVPGMTDIYSNLPNLSAPDYSHTYFVDGVLTEGDAYINNQWQTLLMGTARQGGKGIFALNITDPSAFSEKNAASTLLWEFTDKDDAGVGYVFNQPYLTKLRYEGNDYKWAVIFGNGYQTTETALYVLFIEMGQDGTWTIDTDYLKIPVPSDPSQKIAGISSIYPVDINGDYITDYVYGADLNGHIFKFDLTDASRANWKNKVSTFFTASFAEAGDQPISAPLVVTPHPLGKDKGVMVYFGTGKYLEAKDTASDNAMTQSFYALWDKLDGTVPTKNALLKQTILNEIAKDKKTLRQVSNSVINWSLPKQSAETKQHLGWYVDLFVSGRQNNQGERMVTKPIVHDGKILFTTLIPNQNPCEFGGQSWIMSLNAENGGSLSEFTFDLNEDGQFDDQDKITVDNQGNKAIPAGLLSPVGILAAPATLPAPDKSHTTILLNGNTGVKAVIEKTGTLGTGRKQEKIIK
jgi:type IV pilus assembly protein PilY1